MSERKPNGQDAVDDGTKGLLAQRPLGHKWQSMPGKHSESLSKHRGSALSDFLYQMREHNAGVVGAFSGAKRNGEHK
jgi:hypothetical protein